MASYEQDEYGTWRDPTAPSSTSGSATMDWGFDAGSYAVNAMIRERKRQEENIRKSNELYAAKRKVIEFYNKGDIDGAVNCFIQQKGIIKHPLLLALLYYEKGNLDEVLNCCSGAAKYDHDLIFLRGMVYYKKGIKENAAIEIFKALSYYNIEYNNSGIVEEFFIKDKLDLKFKEAFPLILEQAEKGNAKFFKFLADFYYRGWGTEKNKNKAQEWYEKAIAAGDRNAFYEVGLFLIHNGCGYSLDTKKGIKYLKTASSMKHPEAGKQLRLYYMKKIGFTGYGEATGLKLTVFLSFIFTTGVFFIPFGIHNDIYGDILPTNLMYIWFGCAFVFSFFSVIWRHVIFIVLLSLMTLVSIFGIVNLIRTNEYFFPPALTASFTSSTEKRTSANQERASNRKVERHTHLAAPKIAITLHNEPVETLDSIITTIPPGAFVSVKNKSGRWTEAEYKGNTGWVKNVVMLNSDLSAKTTRETNLLTEPAPSFAQTIKVIKKGEEVTMLGEGSDVYIFIEHGADKGWVYRADIKW